MFDCNGGHLECFQSSEVTHRTFRPRPLRLRLVGLRLLLGHPHPLGRIQETAESVVEFEGGIAQETCHCQDGMVIDEAATYLLKSSQAPRVILVWIVARDV
jgi:hypothetical protein